ncbi:hypothetical protein NMS_1363 [Nonlabens marinus S1-08]|uniref:Uncharacterized protein n=1 Tax=Nonlabens marinus S1-08 TaxID=1454201 RepID=W8VX62_9FLAO|nr:hypothetical protein NMS_1363 [Nonlabens marinus S1-08]
MFRLRTVSLHGMNFFYYAFAKANFLSILLQEYRLLSS